MSCAERPVSTRTAEVEANFEKWSGDPAKKVRFVGEEAVVKIRSLGVEKQWYSSTLLKVTLSTCSGVNLLLHTVSKQE